MKAGQQNDAGGVGGGVGSEKGRDGVLGSATTALWEKLRPYVTSEKDDDSSE